MKTLYKFLTATALVLNYLAVICLIGVWCGDYVIDALFYAVMFTVCYPLCAVCLIDYVREHRHK